MESEILNNQLASAFNFTSEDLAANRQGQLSAAQKQRFDSMNAGCVRWSLIALLVSLMITAALYFIDPEMMVFSGIFAALFAAAFWLAWSTRNDSYIVGTISGEARLRIDRGEKNSLYHLVNIQGYDFTVAPNQYELLQDGTRYVIHYGTIEKDPQKHKAASKQVMSIEHEA